MYPGIRSYDEQAFDNVSEESETKPSSSRNRCSLFQVKAWLSRPKNMVASDPSEVTLETPVQCPNWTNQHFGGVGAADTFKSGAYISAKKHAASDPSEVTQETPQDPGH